ncbi:MAG TPA: hypothetical protein VE077_08235 [Candidatus Methylomirabilis sp.]|nr:hypothetical protein [Candidatus Methylomirabilis sp.]
MKYKLSLLAIALLLVALLAVPPRFAAQSQPGSGTPFYRVVNLGTLGGDVSGADSLNNLGWASGFSNVAGNGDSTFNATLWLAGSPHNLGTLGGPNSGVLWPVKNNIGLISGIAETATPNPFHEDWSCSAFFPTITNLNCLGFVWHVGDKQPTPLPTLGGPDGFATGTNDFGQTVGWAENSTLDATCLGANGRNQVLQFEAVVWGPRPGEIHALTPFPGDPDGAATAINDRAQIVGISGICDQAVGRSSAIHALLWQNGQPIDLGNLGGHGWNTPMAINNRGVIVGFANLPGDIVNGQLIINFIGFVWTREHDMQPLPLLDGDSVAEATGINDQGQIVGVSFGNPSFPLGRPFLYQNGQLFDLTKLIPKNSPIALTGNTDLDINDRGEIAGQACVLSNGTCTSELPAFLLIPAFRDPFQEDDRGDAASAATLDAVSSPQSRMKPQDVHRAIQQRRGFVRFVPVPANHR